MAQTYETPLLVPAVTSGNLADIPARNARRRPEHVALSYRDAGRGPWTAVTSAELYEKVRAVAKGLVAAGVRPGDRVAVMSRTRYEWSVVDFACWTAAAVPVPVYETSSVDQVAWILADSGATCVVAETAANADTVREAAADAAVSLRHLWVLDDGDLGPLVEAGAGVDDATLDERTAAVGPHDLATVIYTSGTTGRPKGCELTHANFLDTTNNALGALSDVVSDESSTLLFLPLAHVFARLIEVAAFDKGAHVGFCPDAKHLLDDLGSFRPTFLLAVPRVLEKVYIGAQGKAAANGTGKVFNAAARVAIAYSRATDEGRVPLRLRMEHAVHERLVYSKLRDAMGGRVAHVISGGAPLGNRLTHFFRGLGCIVLEGYGLTETTAPIGVNLPDAMRIGTVGRPLPGVGVRTDDDGELWTRGVNLFRGYRNNPQATAEAVVDGWFRTGDLAHLDDDGYLTITGRTKELIVTAGGKNVAPAVLEDRLRAHALVSQAVVVGDQRPFIGALVSLDPEMWPTWAANHGLAGVPFEEAATNERVLAELQRAVDFANEAVSRAESIRKFSVLDTDLTQENGYLTPSLKVRRFAVLQDFAHVIDDLYGGPVARDA